MHLSVQGFRSFQSASAGIPRSPTDLSFPNSSCISIRYGFLFHPAEVWPKISYSARPWKSGVPCRELLPRKVSKTSKEPFVRGCPGPTSEGIARPEVLITMIGRFELKSRVVLSRKKYVAAATGLGNRPVTNTRALIKTFVLRVRGPLYCGDVLSGTVPSV